MSAVTNTTAHIIVTVDHTGYTGPVTIGAVATLSSPQTGESMHYQSPNVLRTPNTMYYETIFTLLTGSSYVFYAVADGALELAGGSLPMTMNSEQEKIHVIVYGQPQIPPGI